MFSRYISQFSQVQQVLQHCQTDQTGSKKIALPGVFLFQSTTAIEHGTAVLLTNVIGSNGLAHAAETVECRGVRFINIVLPHTVVNQTADVFLFSAQ